MPSRDDSPQGLLVRIVSSAAFRGSNGHAELLQYICHHAQAGQDLHEHDIGVALFGLEPGYDVRENPLVSSVLGETRDWLKTYFAGEGKRELLRVAVPKGEFRAFFYEADPAQLAAAGNEPTALERFWMPYFLNQRTNYLIHGAQDEDTMLIPEAYAVVQLALLFERHQASLQMIPSGVEVPAGANAILTGTPVSNALIARYASGVVESGVMERIVTEDRQVITILAAPAPEGILPVVQFAVSDVLLERALHQVGPEWPPHFRLTL